MQTESYIFSKSCNLIESKHWKPNLFEEDQFTFLIKNDTIFLSGNNLEKFDENNFKEVLLV